MHNELTQKDLDLMQQELDHRRIEVRPQLLELVKEARAFGDLSENFEYKMAKQDKNHNEGRIRYLENMMRTSTVIPDAASGGGVNLYDSVTVYLPEDDEEETYQIVTTMRQNALKGLISRESPVGKALLGGKVGERVLVEVNKDYGYYMEIRSIVHGADDGSIPLNSY